MRSVWTLALAAITPAISLAADADSQGSPGAAGAPAAPVFNAPAIARHADELLQRMGTYIGSAGQFTFRAAVTFDHVLPSGQKLQYEAAEEVVLDRSGGLYVAWRGDLGERQFWYDGGSVTLFDPNEPFYASDSAPGDIDAMLGKVIDQLGFSPPLADFLYRDPYKVMMAQVRYGVYLGRTEVNGRSCDALAFVERDVDWQIWIDTGPQLTPCKLVITYKTQPSLPQFSAILTDWDFMPRIAESVFKPQLPAGVEKIPFASTTSMNRK